MAEDNIFEDDSTIPKSNWFMFENVGDFVQGELVEEPFDKEGKFGTQKIYPVKITATSDESFKVGDEVNVALKHTSHKMNIQQLKRAEIGDIVGFKFKEEVDTGKVNPAKSIEVRIRHQEK